MKLVLEADASVFAKRLEQVALALFVLAFLGSVWVFFVGWRNPILEVHGFRQTQTALTAYYLIRGGNFFAYETPILGAPWSIPFELPVYQWFVAKFSLLTGLDLDPSGRLIARIFHWLSLVPVYWIGVYTGLNRLGRFLLLTFFLLSPILLFWSRTFMIESTALFFALGYFAFFLAQIHAANEKNRRWLALGTASFGAIAAAVKITTFAAFGAVAGIILSWQIIEAAQRSQTQSGLIGFCVAAARVKIRRFYEIAATIFIPALALVLWTKFADAHKEANPLAQFITSKALQEWNFGKISQRLDHNFWNMLFRKQLTGSLGHRTTVILAFLALPLIEARFRRLWLLSFVLFLAPPLIFTNLHIVHEYYAYANVPFLPFGFAIVLTGLFHKINLSVKRDQLRASVGVILAIVGFTLLVREYAGKPFHVQAVNDQEPVEFAHKLREVMPADSVLYVYGFDWHPMLVYYSEHRGLMNRDGFAIGSEKLEASLTNLGERKIGAALFCGAASVDKELQAKSATRLGLNPEIKFSGTGCVAILPTQ